MRLILLLLMASVEMTLIEASLVIALDTVVQGKRKLSVILAGNVVL